MNCKNCHRLLEPQARFCPQCGISSEENTLVSETDHTMRATRMQSWSTDTEATLITQKRAVMLAIKLQSISQELHHMEEIRLPEPDSSLQPERPLLYSQQQAPSHSLQNEQSSQQQQQVELSTPKSAIQTIFPIDVFREEAVHHYIANQKVSIVAADFMTMRFPLLPWLTLALLALSIIMIGMLLISFGVPVFSASIVTSSL